VKKVIFAAAGTAGHIEPALAVAHELKQLAPGTKITFIGTKGGLEKTLVSQAGYPVVNITKAAFPRRLNKDALMWKFRFLKSVVEAIRILKDADVVIGFGGYVCGTSYLAAKLSGVPIIAHEANAKKGMSNRLAVFCRATILTAFPDGKHEVVGIPLRRSIVEFATKLGSERAHLRNESLLSFKLDPSKPTILIFGGSLGSRKFNSVVASILDQLLANGFQLIHAVGKNNELPEPAAGYVPVSYIDDMPKAYAAADLAICRAGAVTTIETGLLGIYSVYVPLAIGNGEQVLNAQAVVSQGGGVMVADSAFSSDWILSRLPELMKAALAWRDGSHTILSPLDAASVIAARAQTVMVSQAKD